MALSRFKEPLHPPSAVPGEFQKELFLMTPMGDVPYIPRDVVSVRSGHFPSRLNASFARQKQRSKAIIKAVFSILFYGCISDT
jgi:hypothetical protein